MRITEVSVEVAEGKHPASHPWRSGLPRRSPKTTAGYLRISTDDGIVGRAPTNDVHAVQALVRDYLSPELVGEDPLMREALWRRVWEINRLAYMSVTLIGLVDVALWDIAGMCADMPVYKLLGGARTELPAYASTVTFDSVEEYLDVADQCLGLGFRAIKLHAWGDPRRDAQLATTLREHVGGEVDLMFDGSAGWDLPDAIYVAEALADARFRWYEEPMIEHSVAAYRTLAQRTRVPLLVAEVVDGAHWTAADHLHGTAASYVRTSTTFKAGITGAMRVAHLAESFHARAEVHGAGLANEHLCMSIPNTTYYEALVTTNPVKQDPRLTTRAALPAPTKAGIGYPD